MSDRLRQISLRQFRERAVEIREPMDIAIRDRDGNIQVIGFYTPYRADAPRPVEIPIDDEVPAGPRMISTPAEAAAAAPQVRPFPKSAQTGRKRS